MPTQSDGERRPSVSPPAGKRPRLVIAKNVAAASSARPMPSCTFRRDQAATTPAPSHAPATDAAIIPISVVISTSTIAMKMKACTIVGSAWPTLRVPGIFSSGTMPLSFQMRRRRREGADAERVEEIRDEADRERHAARAARASSLFFRRASGPRRRRSTSVTGAREREEAAVLGARHVARIVARAPDPLQFPPMKIRRIAAFPVDAAPPRGQLPVVGRQVRRDLRQHARARRDRRRTSSATAKSVRSAPRTCPPTPRACGPGSRCSHRR